MRVLFLLLCLLHCTWAFGQGYVFVLVDVSKSVDPADLREGRLALRDVLLGQQPTNTIEYGGQNSDLSKFRVQPGDKLVILCFGEKSTVASWQNRIYPVTMSRLPDDVVDYVEKNYPSRLTDNRTYLSLAKARVAEYAKSQNLSSYRLYLVTDNVNDDFNGKDPSYTSAEQDLINGYGTVAHPVKEQPFTRLLLKNSRNQAFSIELVPEVDISKYVPPGQNGSNSSSGSVSSPTAPEGHPVIKLISYAGGELQKPVLVKTEDLNITWQCNDCPAGTKYNVYVGEIEGRGYKERKPNLSSTSVPVRLPGSGKYRIRVTDALNNAQGATTYIELESSGLGWVIALLILGGMAALGFVWWNRQRTRARNSRPPVAEPPPYNTGGYNSGGSSNSNYF